jgi:hypothetical protein
MWIGLQFLHSGWAALLIYHLGMILILSLDQGWGLARDLFHSTRYRLLVPAMLLGGAAGACLYALWPAFAFDLDALFASLGLGGNSRLIFWLYFCAVNPWLEELYWRGYLGQLDHKLHPIDLWFAGYHAIVFGGWIAWPWTVLALAVLAAAGWFWRQIARAGNGLLLPALSHLAADVTIALALFAVGGA